MTDLFVSYKSEDRARVAPLVAALEADGVAVWWDAHIGGGTEWRESIETELAAARCVLVVWSERSIGREGSFVRDEATRSLRRGAYLPVRIDPVEPPLGFGETQALSLIGWKGDRSDLHYQALLAAVRAVIAGTPRPVAPTYQQPKRGIDRRLVIGGGVAAVAVAGAGGWWATHRGGGAPGDSVAVLPFENLSGDPSQAFFSDGIAEELRSALTRIASLKVAAGASSELMRDVDVPTAASKLGVANIVTGTVRRGAGMLRINANLVDGRTGLTHWSDTYNRAIGDTLAIQTDIADSVAGALSITLGKAQKALLTQGDTANPVAKEAYLRGLALVRKNKLKESLVQFKAAIAADPTYAKAYNSLAGNGAALAANTLSGRELTAALAEAETAARRAMALAPGWGKPFSALGTIYTIRLQISAARAAYDAAYKALPGDATVLRTRGSFLASIGDGEAIALYRRSVALDPLRLRNPINFASVLLNLGRFDEAIASARAGLADFPNDNLALVTIATAQLAKGQPAEAMKTAALLPPDDSSRMAVQAIAPAATDRAASDRALKAYVAKYGDSYIYEISQIHAQRGEPDLAFAAIARAWNARDPGLIQLKVDPLLAPIRADPRFGEWLRRIGFP